MLLISKSELLHLSIHTTDAKKLILKVVKGGAFFIKCLIPDKNPAKQMKWKDGFENFPTPSQIPVSSPVLRVPTQVSLWNTAPDLLPMASYISMEVQLK